MKILLPIFAASSLFFLPSCSTGGQRVISGSVDKNDINEERDLIIQGSLTVRNLATRDLMVQGSARVLRGNSVVDGRLLIQGTLTAEKLTVNDGAEVQGTANLTECAFKKNLTLTEGELDRTTVDGDLIVKKKIVTLKSGVTITGKISFEEGPGVVRIASGASNIHILQGIENGAAQTSSSNGGSSSALHF